MRCLRFASDGFLLLLHLLLLLLPALVLIAAANPTIKPRPLSASSIPGLLSCLQTEWDSLMSEAFTLKTHLEQACPLLLL